MQNSQGAEPPRADLADPLDQVVLVDEHDNQIGVMDKVEAHRGNARRHRAISVFLYDKEHQLLIQKRSLKKIVGADQWANTACGNLRPNESYLDCAARRLREELGIETLELRTGQKFEYHLQCNQEFSEWEIDQAFFATVDDSDDLHLNLNPDEVSETRWISLDHLAIELKNSPEGFAPWFRHMVEQGLHLE